MYYNYTSGFKKLYSFLHTFGLIAFILLFFGLIGLSIAEGWLVALIVGAFFIIPFIALAKIHSGYINQTLAPLKLLLYLIVALISPVIIYGITVTVLILMFPP